MTLHNRQLPGHRLVARQRNGGGIFDVPDGDGNGHDGPGGGNGSSSSSDPGPTSQPTPSLPPTTSSKPTPSTTKTRQPPTTTKEPETTSTSSEAKPTTTSDTATSSDSATSISSTTSTSKTSISPVIVTAPPVIKTTTSSGLLLPSTTISAEPSATTSAAPSGASTGTIIGGVVGGLAAIAAIGIIVAFILRRMRKRREEEEEFNSDDFVRPPNMSEPEFQRSSTFDPNPPNMAQLGRNEIISTYSSPGMAGHGAYTYAQDGSAPVSAGSSNGGMQERSNYVYGQGYEGDDNLSDHAHGVYSSEPQVQAAYNPEAYGSYAYSTEGQMAAPGGYMNYHQNEVQHGYAHGGDGDFAPLSSPYDNAPPATASHGAPPALVAGGGAVAAGRGTNTRSVYDDADAYGGI